MAETKEEKKIRIFHTGGIYGPLDTADGRLQPGKSLPVRESLAKKFVKAYKHIKLASDIIPPEKGGKGKDDSKEVDALKKEVKGLNERGEEMGEKFKLESEELKKDAEEIEKKYDALEGLLGKSKDSEKSLKGALGEFLKVDEKKLKALQKKHEKALDKKDVEPKTTEAKK